MQTATVINPNAILAIKATLGVLFCLIPIFAIFITIGKRMINTDHISTVDYDALTSAGYGDTKVHKGTRITMENGEKIFIYEDQPDDLKQLTDAVNNGEANNKGHGRQDW